ncbi:MAG TPA: thioredoxin family protein [Bacteroidales bacterium]
MSLTPTKSIPLGFAAPDFQLPDVVSGKPMKLHDIQGKKGTLVMFICNHCPYVKHVIHELVNIGNEYIPKGIGMVAISSNDVANYPDDSPEKMKELALSLKFPFPYLYDESQEVAKAYDAACTPDFDLFDASGKCVYRGQLDGSRPGNDILVSGKDLRAALELVLKGKKVPENQFPSVGCNIKWKK